MVEADQAPLVSVIIVCHNDGRWLPRCLDSLRLQTVFGQIELILADNASADGSTELARDLISSWPRARFLSTGGDNGFGVACNCAAAAARGQFLFLLNPDTWLEPDCVEQFCHALEREQAGAAGGTLLDYEGQTRQSEGGSGFDAFGNALDIQESNPTDTLMCPASFFFIRKDVFMRVGMMDTKWFLYGEEMDLSWRIWIAGERILLVRDARIHHQGAVNVNPSGEPSSTGNRTSIQKRFLANRNRLLFIAKNCQHILLLMLLPCLAMVTIEGLLTWVVTRNASLAQATSLDAVTAAWRLRNHILQQRRLIATFRCRSDFWMLRFFRFGFGRWNEVEGILKRGFPKIS